MMKFQAIVCVFLVSLGSWATAFAPTQSTIRKVAHSLEASFSADDFVRILDEQVMEPKPRLTVAIKTPEETLSPGKVLLIANGLLISSLLVLSALHPTDIISADAAQTVVQQLSAVDDVQQVLIDQSAGFFFY